VPGFRVLEAIPASNIRRNVDVGPDELLRVVVENLSAEFYTRNEQINSPLQAEQTFI
jgi:hypothetical protein